MPQIYGWQHWLYLLAVAVLMVAAFFLLKKYVKTEKGMALTIRLTGGLLLLAIIWNRLSIAILRDGWDSLIPGSFCGLTSLTFSLSTLIFPKNSKILHCLVYCALLGGTLTHVYPDFIGQAPSIWYPMTISGLVHHSIMLFLALLMLFSGYVRPELKKWPILPIGLAFYMSFGLFLITNLGYSDAIYIFEPILPDTPLNWIGIGMIFLPAHAAFLWAWERLDLGRKLRLFQFEQ